MNRITRTFAARFQPSPAARLRADLATYTSESDLADMYAILARYPAEQTEEIRNILHSNSLLAA